MIENKIKLSPAEKRVLTVITNNPKIELQELPNYVKNYTPRTIRSVISVLSKLDLIRKIPNLKDLRTYCLVVKNV